MLKYFTKDGEPLLNGEVNDVRIEIINICDKFFKNMRKNKASIIEMRAMSEILSGEVSLSATMEILNKQVEIDEIRHKKDKIAL